MDPHAAAEEDAVMQTLYTKIGSAEAIAATVDVFYKRLLADPVLEPFFEGVSIPDLSRKQAMFLAYAFGGIPTYEGPSLAAAHARLVRNHGLNLTHFDLVAGHFVAALHEMGVKQEYVDEATKVLLSTRPMFDPAFILESEEVLANTEDEQLEYGQA